MIFKTIIMTFSAMFLKSLIIISNWKFSKKNQKNFLEKKWKKNFFWKKLIFEKTPSLSEKMMLYHKMAMSGVYEKVF